MRSLHTPKVWTCYKCRVPLAGTCRSKNTSLQLPPICFCTLEGLNFGGRQHRRVGEQQQEQQQPLLRPPRSNRKHGKPVRSRFTAAGDSAQGRRFSLISMAASVFFFDRFVPLLCVLCFCILSLLSHPYHVNVMYCSLSWPHVAA